jgi:hypothetical protein
MAMLVREAEQVWPATIRPPRWDVWSSPVAVRTQRANLSRIQWFTRSVRSRYV